MKRSLATLVCLLFLLGLFSACAADWENEPSESSDVVSSVIPSTPSTPEAPQASQEPMDSEPFEEPSSSLSPIGSRYGSSVAKDVSKLDAGDVDDLGYQNDRLPSDAALATAYAGRTVRLLAWESESHQTYPKEDSATDALASKLYWHWRAIEDRFGITIEPTYSDSAYRSKAKFLAAARAEDADYDLIQTQSLFPIILANEGRLSNLARLQYPDLAMPWWSDSLKEWIQADAMFFICSNSSAMSLSNLSVVYSNEEMIAQKGLETPISLTLSGRWTLDQMNRISQAFASNAALTGDQRRYGFVADDTSRLGGLYYACGFSSVVKDDEGYSEFGFDDAHEWQAITAAIAKLEGMFTDGSAVIRSGDDITDMLNGQTAMLLGFWEQAYSLEGDSYSAVPMPMLDEAQYATKGYRSVHRDYVDTWCIPAYAADKTLSGMILEASASSEYRSIAPFYCFTMERYYADEAQGEQVIALLRASIIYDFGRAAQEQQMGAEGYWTGCFSGGYSNRFESDCKYLIDLHEDSMTAILKKFKAYKDQ